jgi:hypothetical protein
MVYRHPQLRVICAEKLTDSVSTSCVGNYGQSLGPPQERLITAFALFIAQRPPFEKLRP